MRLYDNAFESDYEEIKTFYPVWYREVFEMDAIWRVAGGQLDGLRNGINSAIDNCFISTADEDTIENLENFLYIKNEPNRTLSDRRAFVSSFFIGNGHIGEKEIREIVNTFTSGEVEVVLVSGTAEISVKRELSDKFNLSDCRFVLLKRMPAHLGLMFKDKIKPIIFKNLQEMLMHRLGIQTCFFNRGDVLPLLLDGSQILNGEMLLNQAFAGVSLKEFSSIIFFNSKSKPLNLSVTISNVNIPNCATLELEAISTTISAKNTTFLKNIDVKTTVRVYHSYYISGSVIIDSMYELDGLQFLNGERKLNANIIKEVI